MLTRRETVKADLVNKIVYDDPAVFKRLRVGDVDNNFVARCDGSFGTDNKAYIDLLQLLTQQA